MAYNRSDFEFITDEDWKTTSNFKEDPIEDLINRNSIGEARYQSIVTKYSLKVNEHITEPILNDELRIVIIGKTGEGKSATANTILGKKVFKDDFTSESVTSKSRCETVVVNGRKISVMDTPGLLDTSKSDINVLEEIARVMKIFSEGVHVFIYVMSIGNPRFTQEDLKTLNEIEGLFGGHFKTFTLLVYTRAETELTETTLDKFFLAQRQKADSALTLFLDQLQPNIVAVNNKTSVHKERQRNQSVILGMIDRLRLQNERDVYTTAMFNRAVKEKDELEKKGQKKGWSPEVMDAVDLAIAADPDVAKRAGELNARVNERLMRRLEEKEIRLHNLEEELQRQAVAIQRQSSLEHQMEARLKIDQEVQQRAEIEAEKRRDENEKIDSLQKEIQELKTLLHSKETTSQVQEINKEHDGILEKIGGFIVEGVKKVGSWLMKKFF